MLELAKGNLLEADVEALVNTVNCVGVMGKGIALQFKQAFPENTRAYERACRANELQPGKMLVVPTGVVNPKYIINFPTKIHWKGNSKIPYIQVGLKALVQEIRARGIKSIAIPPLGCGNGGLDWAQVYPLIRDAFADQPDVRVLVYAPVGAPSPESMPVASKNASMTRVRALMVKLFERYCEPGYRLTRLEVQKLAYFLQEADEPLKLAFVKHTYGPYAENLNFLLQHMEGHFIRGYGDRTAQIELLPNASELADKALAGEQEAIQRLQEVSRLIEGFETPHGLELLATVHWVMKHEMPIASDANVAINRVYAWNTRKKRMFRPEHIARAWNRLMEQDAVNATEAE